MPSFNFQRCCCSSLAILCVLSQLTFAGGTPPPRISRLTREQIIHAFNDELIYIRTNFPQGKTGLKLKNGAITPSGPELQRLMSLWGPAAKPGERARISAIFIKDDYIRFEINGGPLRGQKWYQRLEVGGAVGGGPIAPTDPSKLNSHGSFVDLYFDQYVPEITGPELKDLLRPVFDFDAKSGRDAYLETVPPQVKDAISDHRVLVGMNHEMVIYSKGRPPKKVRENMSGPDGPIEYEEWIYGEPPQDVDFVRFIGDEVIRVETMKVDGQKIIRAAKEIDLGTATVAKKQDEHPANAPTLRRPGEEMPDADPAASANRVPSLGAPLPGSPGGSPGGVPGSNPGPPAGPGSTPGGSPGGTNGPDLNWTSAFAGGSL